MRPKYLVEIRKRSQTFTPKVLKDLDRVPPLYSLINPTQTQALCQMETISGKLLGFVNAGEPSVPHEQVGETKLEAVAQDQEDAPQAELRVVSDGESHPNTCGYVYDPQMMIHANIVQHHDEQPARISEIFQTLVKAGCISRMGEVKGREVTQEEVLLVHAKSVLDELEGFACASTCSAEFAP